MPHYYFSTLSFYSANSISLTDGSSIAAGGYIHDTAALAALPVAQGGAGDAFFGSGISLDPDGDTTLTLGEAFSNTGFFTIGDTPPTPTYIGQTVINGVTAPVFSYTAPSADVVGGTVTIHAVAFPSDPGDLSASTFPGLTSTDTFDYSAFASQVYDFDTITLLTPDGEYFVTDALSAGGSFFLFEPDEELAVGQTVQTIYGTLEYIGTTTISGVAYPAFESPTALTQLGDQDITQIVLLPGGVTFDPLVAYPSALTAQTYNLDGSTPAPAPTSVLLFNFSVTTAKVGGQGATGATEDFGPFLIVPEGGSLTPGDEVDLFSGYYDFLVSAGLPIPDVDNPLLIYVGQYTSPGGQVGYAFSVEGEPAGVFVLFEQDPGDLSKDEPLLPDSYYCFLEGTLIATPDGPRTVETLEIGSRLLTADGRIVQAKWIGRQTVMTMFGPAERLMPVRFAAGSLGDGLPHSDLTVTADHAMLVDGILIHAGALVNGSTITRVPLAEMGDRFTVYHIETEEHEIILANGAPAETFIDNVSRRAFDNYAEFEALYGNVPEMEELDYPRAMSARQVPPAIKAKLAMALEA